MGRVPLRASGRPPGSGRQALARKWQIALMAGVAVAGLVAAAEPSLAATAAANSFKQTNLVASNASFGAKLTDPNLVNAWGLATGPGSPLWVSDNNTGKASVYSGGVKGSAVSLDLTVPVPGGNPTGAPEPTAAPARAGPPAAVSAARRGISRPVWCQPAGSSRSVFLGR